MTTSTMTNIPLAIGAGLAGLAARGGQWCLERMVRSPMGSTAFVLVTGLTLMAGTNALYLQEVRHPAPMFSSVAAAPVSELVAPPPVRPVLATPTEETVQPVAVPVPASAQVSQPESAQTLIGNADIAAMQEKLKQLGLFDGTVDGYYGPKTADAIRAFEQRHGLPRTGAASPQVIEAVRSAPLNTSEAPPRPMQVVAEPAQDELNALIAGLEPAPAAAEEVPAGEPDVEAALFDPLAETSAPPSVPAALDRDLVSEIQRGLSRLGFLQGQANGVADQTTALAIRKFQVFNNFPATGEVSTAVLDMLVAAGAYM